MAAVPIYVDVITTKRDGRVVLVRTKCDPEDGLDTFHHFRMQFRGGTNDLGERVTVHMAVYDSEPRAGTFVIP